MKMAFRNSVFFSFLLNHKRYCFAARADNGWRLIPFFWSKTSGVMTRYYVITLLLSLVIMFFSFSTGENPLVAFMFFFLQKCRVRTIWSFSVFGWEKFYLKLFCLEKFRRYYRFASIWYDFNLIKYFFHIYKHTFFTNQNNLI